MKRLILFLFLFSSLLANAATIYLRSTDGSDADNGSTWALAKATLTNALANAGAGGTCWVSQAHAETIAADRLITSPGTAASPCYILCGNDAAEPPTALATTATYTTTGASDIFFAGFAYYYGITWNCGTGVSAAYCGVDTSIGTPYWLSFENCTIKLITTAASSQIHTGSASSSEDDALMSFVNVVVQFGNTNQSLRHRGNKFRWSYTQAAISGATIPTSLFEPLSNANGGIVDVIGVDLSAAGSGKTIVDSSQSSSTVYNFVDCKLGSSVSLSSSGTAGQGGVNVRFVNCDSTNVNYRYHLQNYAGTISQETTVIRTNGATDGSTIVSRKAITTANSAYVFPLVSDPIAKWNDVTNTALTMTVYSLTDGVTLSNHQAWVEVEYLGSNLTPLGYYTNNRSSSIIAAGTAIGNSSAPWITNSLVVPILQAHSLTFTPQMKGLVRARYMLARPSTTNWFCPKFDLLEP